MLAVELHGNVVISGEGLLVHSSSQPFTSRSLVFTSSTFHISIVEQQEKSKLWFTSPLIFRLGLRIHGRVTNVLVTTHLGRSILQSGQATWSWSGRGIFVLPRGATINASDNSASLAGLPLLKTFFVEVLTTGGFAPDYLFVGFHVEYTDGTLAVDGFALAVVH